MKMPNAVFACFLVLLAGCRPSENPVNATKATHEPSAKSDLYWGALFLNEKELHLRTSFESGFSEKVITIPNAPQMLTLLGRWDGSDVKLATFDRNSCALVFYSDLSLEKQVSHFTVDCSNKSLAVVSGDWNGDGVDTVGIYDRDLSVFTLFNRNDGALESASFQYGPVGGAAFPIAGDWDGDGRDTVGLWFNSKFQVDLKNSNAEGFADISFVIPYQGTGSDELTPFSIKYMSHTAIGVHSAKMGVFTLYPDFHDVNKIITVEFGRKNAVSIPIVGG